MTRLRNYVALLPEQLWIVPALISVLSLVLAYFILTAGTGFFQPGSRFWWLYSGDASTARGLLSSLLTGLLTMTSLVVSVTFVILSLAANQLGPRLISIFMADRQIQTVIGLFLGTITYILVVLRTLNDVLGQEGVPHLAMTVATALALTCLFALLFYVHKIARSIIADTVVQKVADHLQHSISEILPAGESQPDSGPPAPPYEAVGRISLNRSGYIQTIRYGLLVEIACARDFVLHVDVKPGQFVLASGAHATVYAERPLDDVAAREIREAFIIGSERSPAQDLEYGIRQLVEIAIRALSPGINDPFTAIAVLDRLGSAIEQILQRPPLPAVLRDGRGTCRLAVLRSDLDGMVDAAFDQIRQAGPGHPAVLIRLADILGQLAPAAHLQHTCGVLLRDLGKLSETAAAAAMADTDRRDVLGSIAAARISLAADPSSS